MVPRTRLGREGNGKTQLPAKLKACFPTANVSNSVCPLLLLLLFRLRKYTLCTLYQIRETQNQRSTHLPCS